MSRRKSLAKRQPNGDIVREKQDQPLPLHRVRQMIQVGTIEPLYGSPIGRLALTKRIDQHQLDAATRYRADRSNVDRIIGLPRRTARAVDYTRQIGTSLDGGELSDNDARTVQSFFEIEATLGTRSAYHRIVNKVVVDEESPMFGELGTLVTALEILAIGYGFKSKSKKNGRNA